jgi:hypothetical protein
VRGAEQYPWLTLYQMYGSFGNTVHRVTVVSTLSRPVIHLEIEVTGQRHCTQKSEKRPLCLCRWVPFILLSFFHHLYTACFFSFLFFCLYCLLFLNKKERSNNAFSFSGKLSVVAASERMH